MRDTQQPGCLSDLKRLVLEDASLVVRDLEGGHDLVRKGVPQLHCPLLLEGFACSYKTLEGGRRQILALHLPNDLCNLPSLLLRHLNRSVGTLTPARVVFVPHATILDWMGHDPARTQALWRATLVEAAISQEWIANVGGRTAHQRTAHLLCEFLVRTRQAGLAHGLTCWMPLTRMELADALGLTGVHVSRTLQWLRDENLIDLRDGTLTVLNWSELTFVAGFDPAYLHHADTAG